VGPAEEHRHIYIGLRVTAIVAATVGYVLAFGLTYHSADDDATLYALLPVVVAAWCFRVPGGLIAGLLALPLKMLLMIWFDAPPATGWLGSVVALVIGPTFGWGRWLMIRTGDQAKQLSAEREALQKEVAERHKAEQERSMFRGRARLASEHLDLLAQSGLALADSLDYETTAARVACVAVPVFADWCILDVLEPDGPPRRCSVAAKDESKKALLQQLQQNYPLRPGSTQPAAQALATGKSFWIERFTDGPSLAATTHDSEHLRIMRALEPQSVISVPLIARGQPLGVLTFVLAKSSRTYGPADINFAEDLGRQCALALDNARLYRAAREEILERKRAEEALAAAGHELEVRVAKRTAELAEANERLLANEEHLRLALDAARMGTWSWDVRNDRIHWDDNLLRLLGMTREEFPGNGAIAITSVHPADQAAVLRAMEQVIADKGALAIEFRSARPVDAVRWLAAQGHVITDAQGEVLRLIGVTQDVTARKEMEQALQASEEMYRGIIEASTEGMCVFSADQRVTFVNARLGAMLGHAPEDLVGQPVLDFLAPEHHADADQQLEVLRAGGRAQRDYRLLPRDGGELWAIVSAAPLRGPSGEFGGVLAMVTDVTARRRLEEQLRQALKMEAVGRLAGGIAHDFNNLLTAITGYAELLLKDLGPDHACADLVCEIEKAAERAALLTGQLLAFSRKQIIAPRILDLNVVVSDLGPMLQRLIGEDVVLSTETAAAPLPVRADLGQLQQILVNLAVNARDAMPRGGALRIAVAAAQMPEAGPAVCLRVTDTGVGMTAEVKAHLFEPFFTTKEPGRGTGLGLSTIQNIVQQNGGVIVVESEPGRGTTFSILLPRSAAELPAPPEVLDEAPVDDGQAATLLVVEDDDVVRLLVVRALTAEGFTVVAASRGEEGIRTAAAFVGPIDLLVADVVMPGMGGREMAECLVRERPNLKVLFVSGYTDDAIIRHGVLDAGGSFLQKPFSPDALVRKVRDLLGPSRSLAQPTAGE
jgi:PAS domain S-box-containing protein